MLHPAVLARDPQSEYLSLSFGSFAFWWVFLLGVHLSTCAYNAGYAKFYWDFDATWLSYTLEDYHIGMPRDAFRDIAWVHVSLAAAHGACVLVILGGSCWKRTLAFSPWNSKSGSSRGVSRAMQKQQTSTRDRKSSRMAARWSLTQVHQKLTHRRGLLGVNGKHFHIILVLKELIEAALQTGQAVRMSKYLPREQLNRAYVALIVVNCWSSLVIYSRWFWKDEAYRRFALLVCDCVLDLMSTVGISMMIVFKYVDQYDAELAGFRFEFLGDDDWVAHMLNEAQLVLVTSWADLAGRVLFSLGLVIASTSMQELLYCSRGTSSHVNPVTPNPTSRAKLVRVPGVRALLLTGPTTKVVPESLHQPSNRSSRQICTTFPFLHRAHIGFAVWGFVLLVLHVHASIQNPLVECMPKVKPIVGALPSCFLVNFNCATIGIQGYRQEVQSEWERFDRSTAVKLHFLHCPALEVPDSIDGFSQLQEIRVYNSSIEDWGASAAVTNAYHPLLTVVSVVRANMTGGLLPLGFQSTSFPTLLMGMYFCETNLQQLPDDLDTKWNVGTSIYLENSNLSSVPVALVRLQPFYLVLAGNPIDEVPPELFDVQGMLYLVLGRTNIRELPRNVVTSNANPPFIDIRDTAVSFFWPWLDPLVQATLDYAPMLLASGSTYCSELERIKSGVSNTFSAEFQADHSPLLMNASSSNWDFLDRAVDCFPLPTPTFFPIEYWDDTYSLNRVPDTFSTDAVS